MKHGILWIPFWLAFSSLSAGTASRELDLLLESPSSRIPLYKSLFVIGRAVEATAKRAEYLAYIDRLAIQLGNETSQKNPEIYFRDAIRLLFRVEGFSRGEAALPLAKLLFHQVLENKKGPPIAMAVLMKAILRNLPFPTEIIRINQMYLLRVQIHDGQKKKVYCLTVPGYEVIKPNSGNIDAYKLQTAPALTNRQILGHYLLMLGRAAIHDRPGALAHQLLRQAWHFSPQTPEIYISLGYLALMDRRLVHAERCYTRAIRLSPESRLLDARLGLAEVYVKQHRLQDAEAELDRILASQADHFHALLLRAEYFLALPDPDNQAAQDILENLLGRHGSASVNSRMRLFYSLGLAHLGRKDVINATRYINMALQIAPDACEVHYAQGELETDREAAILAYGRAIKANDRFAPAYLKRGALHDDRNRTLRALEDYKRFMELLPRHPLGNSINARIAKLKADLNTEE